jgi:pSer/pThr/pTyr-binding forkhead associated (FHA) protein
LDPAKKATTIGRNEVADICMLSDPAIARQHARLLWSHGGFVLEALEGEVRVSSGGRGDFTPIQSHRLEPGDLIQIGSSRAQYQTGRVTT